MFKGCTTNELRNDLTILYVMLNSAEEKGFFYNHQCKVLSICLKLNI